MASCSWQEFLINPQATSISCIGGFFSWASGGIVGGINWIGEQIKIGLKGFADALRPYWVYIAGGLVVVFGILVWKYGIVGAFGKVVSKVI
ncbi:hypothetical protein Ngar_c15720 [Candidatus Nitrososphaera gargensis Ga9.2]|uniref:Uncharacterized protein n=1 Tax=Nitrososphaera gargensis (strain Ga9.2) TaxID=1237085 RepID=K0IFB8_NITGG|nr:hypothetical protein [Candidatus Nitrososphaera gargensis]AFU58505.1 hypothetical protein Ngar_c15720 [Candidatus Nitrososphaera gargensis Ga9.2]